MKNLYREQNLKRGDIILCDGEERIFLTYIEGARCPYLCVINGDEKNFKNGKTFHTTPWREEVVQAKPKEWYEQIPEQGVICWVDDEDENEKLLVDIIVKYCFDDELPFYSETNGVNWRYATPVKPEELYQGK